MVTVFCVGAVSTTLAWPPAASTKIARHAESRGGRAGSPPCHGAIHGAWDAGSSCIIPACRLVLQAKQDAPRAGCSLFLTLATVKRFCMARKTTEFLTDIYTFRKGKKLHPYKGVMGAKKGLFSVNFTCNTRLFQGMTEKALRRAITSGRFRNRGTIRMLPLDWEPGDKRTSYSPEFYKGEFVKNF
jgi:hypothetical protein